jgi:hypothetical protein
MPVQVLARGRATVTGKVPIQLEPMQMSSFKVQPTQAEARPQARGHGDRDVPDWKQHEAHRGWKPETRILWLLLAGGSSSCRLCLGNCYASRLGGHWHWTVRGPCQCIFMSLVAGRPPLSRAHPSHEWRPAVCGFKFKFAVVPVPVATK